MTTPSKGPEIIGVTMMFEAFAIVALGLRFWSQRILGRKLFAHDILVLFGFVCATALAICLVCSVEYGGLGRHAAELVSTPWRLVIFGKVIIEPIIP
ncbi:hypothetical protein MGN70_001909 [Eutypa lata]|nr:hypothetical protein MGN70_001909 [Eutypa lata]